MNRKKSLSNFGAASCAKNDQEKKAKSETIERLTEALQNVKLTLSGLGGVSPVTGVLAITKLSALHGEIH